MTRPAAQDSPVELDPALSSERSVSERWNSAGFDLHRLDPARFDQVLDLAEAYVEAAKTGTGEPSL